VTRSTARSRLVIAAVGAVGVLALVAGCGAGQQSQTSRMQAAVPGTNATVNLNDGQGGTVALRNLTVEYPGDKGYQQGGTAPLSVRVFNNSLAPVHLTGVRVAPRTDDTTANAAQPLTGSVVLVGSAAAAPTGTTGASPTQAPTPTASAAPGGSASPTPTATAEPSGPAGSTSIDVEIPAGGYVVLTPSEGTYLAITDLSRAVQYGDLVNLEFQFDKATATVALPMMTPASGGPRTPLQTGVQD
jgi:hypothetical protein